MRLLAILACVAIALLTAATAGATTTVRLVDTWPAGDSITLHHNQNFYLHLAYTSDQPVHIWARPYFEGKSVNAGSNPSRVYPAGSGEALGWFSPMEPGAQVDEVRITAGDGTLKGTTTIATFPVSIMSDDETVAESARPSWLTRLRQQDKAAQDAAYQKAMNQPFSAGDMLLFYGFMLVAAALGIFGIVGPAWGLWRWRGGWRIAAALPAGAMAFVILRLIVDTARDPTSHNLWPFEIVMAGGACSVVMVVLIVARKLSGAGRTS